MESTILLDLIRLFFVQESVDRYSNYDSEDFILEYYTLKHKLLKSHDASNNSKFERLHQFPLFLDLELQKSGDIFLVEQFNLFLEFSELPLDISNSIIKLAKQYNKQIRVKVVKSLDFNDSSSIIIESCLNDNLDALSLNFQSGLISQLELENIIQEYFFSILSFVRDVDKIIADMFVLKDTDIR